jgi:protein-histidine N-methyltransferase
MSAFTFDFDLEDDLDESFDAIPPQELASVSSLDKTLVSEGAPGGAMPAEEITLSVLVSDNSQSFLSSLVAILCYSAAQLSALPEAFSYSPITLPAPTGTSANSSGHTLARRDLFDVRFQLSLSERDEQNQASVATFVDAPADVVPGTYEGGLKTWECALDLAAYLDRDILRAHAGVAAGRRVCGSRVLEVGFLFV